MKIRSGLALLAVSSLVTVSTLAFAQEQKTAFSSDLDISARIFGIKLDDGSGDGHPTSPAGDLPPLPPPCAKVNPSDAQKVQLQGAFFQHRKDMVTLDANMKLAMLDFESLVHDSTADGNAADTASQKIAAALGAIAASKAALDSNVLFKIMTPEQREPAFECQQIMHEIMMRHKLAEACASLPPPPPGHPGQGGSPQPGPGPGPAPGPGNGPGEFPPHPPHSSHP